MIFFHKDKELRKKFRKITSEETLSEEEVWDKFFQTIEGRKYLLKLQKLKSKGVEDADLMRIFNKMLDEDLKREHKLVKNIEKDLREKIIGIQNGKGGFTCLDCITQEAWIYIEKNKTVTVFDLKDGALFQCDKCGKKIGLGETGWEITYIRFITDKVKQ